MKERGRRTGTEGTVEPAAACHSAVPAGPAPRREVDVAGSLAGAMAEEILEQAPTGDTTVRSRFFALVLDVSATFWQARSESDARPGFTETVDALMVFLNAVVAEVGTMWLHVTLADEFGSVVLFPSKEGGGDVGIVDQIRRGIVEQVRHRQALHRDGEERVVAGAHVAGGLSRALCYISRHQPEVPSDGPSRGATNAEGNPQMDARVLIVQGAEDVAEHYNAMMNAIFSATRLGVAVDGLSLGARPSSLLQQAAFLTKLGAFRHVPEGSREPLALLLLTDFAPDTRTRLLLNRPPISDVDFRASCVCHQKPQDQAIVCPVCLSIFCDDSPAKDTNVCTVCGLNAT